MTRYLTRAEILATHAAALAQSGGGPGLHDDAGLDSAIAQPRQSFGGVDLYPTLVEKAAALCYSLVLNHPFVDGNKRVGVLALDTFLKLNGFKIVVSADEGEQFILALADGRVTREELVA